MLFETEHESLPKFMDATEEVQTVVRGIIDSITDGSGSDQNQRRYDVSTRIQPSPSGSLEHSVSDPHFRDEYGFFMEDGTNDSTSRERILLDNYRLRKWTHMLKNNMKLFRKNPRTVKRRIRKGIPHPVRGFVWKKLAGCEKAQATASKGYYYQTLAICFSSWEAQIERDIHRTFPMHILFRDASGTGQHSLFNVLKVYSIYDNELGYCQGMGFIAGMFLMHMGEEDAFWMLVRVLTAPEYNMRTLFISGMPLTFLRVFQLKKLVARRFPKLSKHLQQENVDIMSLSMQWFITNFCYNLPFKVLLRIWDVFLYENSPKIIFRVALYFFDVLQDRFLKLDFEGIMLSMKEFYTTLDADQVMSKALKVNITTKELQQLEKDYAMSSR